MRKIEQTKTVTAVLIQRKCHLMWREFVGKGKDRHGVGRVVEHSFYCVSGGTTDRKINDGGWCGIPFQMNIRIVDTYA